MKSRYTITDLLKLKKILETDRLEFFLGQHHLADFDDMLIDLKQTIQNIPDCETMVELKLRNWLRSTFSQTSANNLRNFIFEQPIEEVPLKINDPLFAVFAKWRLAVAK